MVKVPASSAVAKAAALLVAVVLAMPTPALAGVPGGGSDTLRAGGQPTRAITASAITVRDSRESGGVVVALESSATPAQVASVLEAAGGELVHTVAATRSLLIRPADEANAEALAKRLSAMPGVRYAEPNRRVRAQVTPNDSLYALQWGLPAVNALVAWDGARASSAIKVAIIDSGAYFAHPDLAGVLDNVHDYDYVNSDSDASDDNGHGTHVAGIIAALTNNGLGVASLAGFGAAGTTGGVTVIPLKVLDENGDGWDEDVALAIRRAADSGARVINLSMGGPGSTSLTEAVAYAHAKGCVLVAAAGNSGLSEVLYPAGAPGVIGVGGVDSELRQAMFSNSGSHVDVVAPGDQVFSTSWPGAFGSGGDLYGYMSGTSMATPLVAAEAALLFSAMPSATNTQIERAIQSSARDLGPVGRDNDYGNGIVDVAAALSKLTGYDYLPPVTTARGVLDGWSSDTVTVTLAATDDVSGVVSTQYAVGDGRLVSYAGPFAVSAEGVTRIAFSSVDRAGNREQTRVATVRIDRTAPVSVADVARKYVGQARITIRASDGLSGVTSTTWALDGVTHTGTEITTSDRGFHTLSYESVDAAGNVEARRAAAFFVVDQPDEVPPLTTAALGVQGGWSSAPETISLVAAGGNGAAATSTWYSLDGGVPRQYTGPFVVSKEGTTTIEFCSYDGGTPEAFRAAPVRVDMTEPTVTVDPPAVFDDGVLVSATATDALSGVDPASLAWSLDGGKTWMWGSTVTLTEAGSYDVVFRAHDLAGNEARAVGHVVVMGTAVIRLNRPATVAPAWGVATTLSGAVTPAPSLPATVTIEARAYGASVWAKVARVRTASDGRFSAPVTPRVRTQYRAVFGGDGILLAAGPSNAVVLKPKVRPTIASSSQTRTRSGAWLQLSGRIVPAHTRGVYVVAERRSASGWASRRSMPVTLVGDGSGGSTWQGSIWLPRGTWRIRVYHPGDILHGATYSAVRYATVR